MGSKKYFIGGAFIGFVLLFSFLFTLPDGKLHIYFCDVGQGDGAYIKYPDGEDMLIDGGPNNKVLGCLGRYMPFYDRTIDVVVLTHPQKDHMQGLISVIDRYNVKYFVIGVEGNNTEGYKRLLLGIKNKNIMVKNLYKGDTIGFGEAKMKVMWPTREWVAKNVPMEQCSNDTMTQCNNDTIAKSNNGAVLGLATDTELNDFSFYMHLSYGDFDALFTGDGDVRIQPLIESENVLPDVEVLKFPHHGSRTGMMVEFLDKIKPELSIISVGKNSYGHPTKEAIEILRNRDIKILRTDQEGDIEVVTDGKGWEVMN